MQESEIRKAVKADLPGIRACAENAYRMYIECIGREPAPMVADFAASIERGHLLVIDQDDAVAGFVVYYEKIGCVHLENVAVNPDFQKRGIGKKLINFVEKQARADGYSRIELYTNAKMTENLGLYPRLGYREFDRRIENGFDRVYFSKVLD